MYDFYVHIYVYIINIYIYTYLYAYMYIYYTFCNYSKVEGFGILNNPILVYLKLQDSIYSSILVGLR